MKGRPPLFALSWKWIKENSDSIKIAFAVLAAIWALVEYRSKDYVERVKNATEVIEKFYASDNFKSLVVLDDFWTSDELTERRSLLNGGKLTGAEYRKQVFDKAKAKHRSDLIKAIRGLKSVAICGIQGRCESVTLCMYSAQVMQDLRCNFRENIAELSESNASCVIDEINYFADKHCPEWIASYMGVATYASIADNVCLYDKENKKSKIGDECDQSIIHKRSSNFLRRLLD